MEIIYNKLVRDKIPETIIAKGQTPIYRVLDDDEYLIALNQKLQEEVAEYLESNSTEELCDISEVISAILALKQCSPAEFTQTNIAKLDERGGFSKKYFLEKVLTPR